MEYIMGIGVYNQNPAGIYLPSDFVTKKLDTGASEAGASASSLDGATASGTVVTDQVSSNAATKVLVESPQTPVKLSELILAILKKHGAEGLAVLLQKIESTKVTTTESTLTDVQLCATLSDLLNVVDDPTKLQEEINKLEPNFCVALKAACSESESALQNYASLAAVLLEHGPVVGAFNSASKVTQNQTIEFLAKSLAPATAQINNIEEYKNNLVEFKRELNQALMAHTALIERSPKLHSIANTKLAATMKELSTKHDGKIAAADIAKLAKDLQATAKQTKEDPQAAHTLDKYMNMMFSAEGAAMGAMLVPFLASILSGTLGELPLIGPMIKSMCGLTAGVADMAHKLVQTLSVVNQAKTSQQLATMQQERTAPPAPTSRVVDKRAA